MIEGLTGGRSQLSINSVKCAAKLSLQEKTNSAELYEEIVS